MSCIKKNGTPLGTRFNTNCLEAVVQTLMATTNDFVIEDSNINNASVWQQAIADEKVIPLFEIYEPSSEDVEASKYETGNFVYRTSKAVKKLKAELYLSLCGHKSLASLEGSKYTRIIEITEEGQLALVKKTDTTNMYQGQSIKDFDVSMRKRATKEKAPYTELLITFADFKEFEDRGYYFDVDFNPILDLKGLYGINLEVVTINAAVIVANITAGCDGNLVGLTPAMLEFISNSGNAITISSITNVTPTQYTITLSAAVESGKIGTKKSAGVIGAVQISGDYYIGATDVKV